MLTKNMWTPIINLINVCYAKNSLESVSTTIIWQPIAEQRWFANSVSYILRFVISTLVKALVSKKNTYCRPKTLWRNTTV